MVSKRGFSPTAMIFAFVFLVFFIVIIFGIIYYAAYKADSIMGGITGLSIGDVDFHDKYEETLGSGINSLINTLSVTSLFLILGLVVVMMIMGYHLRDTNKLWIIMDIFLILAAFLCSVYLSNTFDDLINSNGELFSVYSGEFETPSRLLLNLPIIVPIVGVLIMIVTYATVRKKESNVVTFQG